jgi:hypothetical protein
VNTLEKGTIFFVGLFLLLTIVGLWGAGSVQSSPDVYENERFRGLLKGIIWIMGVSAVICIPLLRKNKKFEEAVL